MENYGDALKYAEVSAESAGTAIDKYSAWVEGIEGRLNSLKASFEKLSMSVLNSELITGSINILTWLLDAITWLSDAIGGLNTVLYVTLSVLAVMKIDATIVLIKNIGTAIMALGGKITEMIATMVAAKASGLTMGQSISAAFNMVSISASSAQIAVGAVAAALGLLIVAFNAAKQDYDKAVTSALSNANAHHLEAEAAEDCKESLDELIRKYEELASKSNWSQDENALQSVKEIQDQIVGLVGDHAQALDLVNGKLDAQLKILQGISGEYKNIALQEAEAELAEAKVAVQKQTGWTLWSWISKSDEFELGPEYYYGSRPAGKYGDIKVETKKPGPFSVENYATDMIKVNFDTAEEFAEQYEAVMEYQKSIAGTFDETDKEAVKYFSELTEFLDKYRDVYTKYKTAKGLVDKLTNPAEIEAPKESGFKVALKSSFDLLEEVQEGYNGISDALANVTSEGYLTADALSTLFKLEKDNALGGLKLADILERDSKGYKLAGDALQQYIESLVSMYQLQWASGSFATQADKDNAIANLQTLQAVLATLALTQEDATDIGAAYREELEQEREMYENQLDKFGELIDLRKELLETYKEELDYQKELEKRQKNVSALQAKLSVARLDQSAAGQARVRKLESELQSAQEELEDFTLEHAIDVLVDHLDNSNAEWEAIVQNKLNEITSLLEGINTSTSGGISIDTEWLQGVLAQVEALIGDAADGNVETTPKDEAFKAAQDYVDSRGLREGDKTRWGQDKNFLPLLRAYIAAGGSLDDLKGKEYHAGGLVGGVSTLTSGEEFAKLLQGEFVSTPAQMKRFMEKTLPQIASYATANSTNQFNAPLIAITCESVTPDSIPELERIVNEAVKQIKRDFDSGMSRTGFKRPTPKRLV